MFLSKDDFQFTNQDRLRKEVKTIFERDAKHALKSPNPNERLLGIRAAQSFLDYQ